MPSVHVDWAFIVAWYIAVLGRGPLRWVGALHLAITVFVVVATANHWWLDGIAAVIIVFIAICAQVGGRRVLGRLGEWRADDAEHADRLDHAGAVTAV
jgi:hypothetical protein